MTTYRAWNAADIAGEKFGNLTAIEPTPRVAKGGRSRIWLFRCDCGSGEKVFRSVSQVRSGVRLGQTPRCRACWRELMQGLRDNKRRQHLTEIFTRRVLDGQSIWSEGASERLENAIREEAGVFEDDDFSPSLPIRTDAGWIADAVRAKR